jgi:hypothetical protein
MFLSHVKLMLLCCYHFLNFLLSCFPDLQSGICFPFPSHWIDFIEVNIELECSSEFELYSTLELVVAVQYVREGESTDGLM